MEVSITIINTMQAMVGRAESEMNAERNAGLSDRQGGKICQSATDCVPQRKFAADGDVHSTEFFSRSGMISGRTASFIIVFGAGCWLFATTDARRVDSAVFLRPVAERMKLGEVYDPQILTSMDDGMSFILKDPVCDHQALQDLAVVRTALAETAFQEDNADVADKRLSAAEEAARATLACSPGSATAWIILAWIEHIRHEDSPLLRAYLERSYRFGPYEGWVLVRRMEMLLSLFPALNEDERASLRQAVEWIANGFMSEFIGEQYVAAKPEQRRALREILAGTPERQQKRAAEIIREMGEDIELPFVEPLGSRPWK